MNLCEYVCAYTASPAPAPAAPLPNRPPMSLSTSDDDTSFERKDEIRQRLRIILRQTTPKQKSRLLYGLVALPKKGFHCRTRDELQKLDTFLRLHFPRELTSGDPIAMHDMELKLQELDGGKPSESLQSHSRRGAQRHCVAVGSVCPQGD
ncbi:MAG: hypothetical protein P4L40_03520 [Terracidiphilus sp.]|nr:hypothetical protein [Terracidiphilus sp.]